MNAGLLYLKVDKVNSDGTVTEGVAFPSDTEQVVLGTYTYEAKRMGGAPTITDSFYFSRCLDKEWKNDENNSEVYAEYNGERFYVSSIPSPTKDNTNGLYKHEITLTSRREILDNTLFFDVVTEHTDTQDKDRYRSNQTKFSFGGDIREFIKRINDSLVYVGIYDPTKEEGKQGYHLVLKDGYGTDDVKEISIDSQYITEVIQEIYNTYNLTYYWKGEVCYVGEYENDLTSDDNIVRYGRNEALLSVSEENSNNKIVDMITGYGSSDNIPYYYPNDDEFGEAVFSVENANKSQVSIQLSKAIKCLGNIDCYNNKLSLYKVANGKETSQYLDFAKDFAWFSNGESTDGGYEATKTFGETVRMWVEAKSGTTLDFTSVAVSAVYKGSGLDGKEKLVTEQGTPKISVTYKNLTTGDEEKVTVTNVEVGTTILQEIIEDGVYQFSVSYSLTYKSKFYRVKDGQTGIVMTVYASRSDFDVTKTGGLTMSYTPSVSDFSFKDSVNNKFYGREELGITLPDLTTSNYGTAEYGFTSRYDADPGRTVYYIDLKESSSADEQISITITDRIWLDPSQNLMPSIYRESKGAERFYYALNDTHKIPGSDKYYEFKNKYVKGNPHQGSVSFDDIKPTINGIRNDVIQSDGLGQLFGEIADVAFDSKDSDVKDSNDEYAHQYFYIKLHKFSGEFGFDLFSHALAKENAVINMIDCQGCPACAFPIQSIWNANKDKCYNCVSVDENGNLKAINTEKDDYILGETAAQSDKLNQNSQEKEIWIAVQKDNSTLGIVMPNAAGNFKPKKGDKFVITGIKPPKVLVTAAEHRLDEALIKYMSENNEDSFTYSIKFSRIFLAENPDYANKLNENAKICLEFNGVKHELFVSNYSVKRDGNALAEVDVELVKSLEVTQSEMKQMIDSVKGDVLNSIGSGLNTGSNNSFNAATADKMYLSKLNNDTAQGLITFLRGLKVGNTGNYEITADGLARLFAFMTANFNSGLYGQGASIDDKGAAELDSLFVRKFISTPKFVFNEISVTKAEQWNTNGYGTIESVDTTNRQITLKLEENDYGSLSEGDICRGIYADIDNSYDSDSIEEGALDDCNFVTHKGFFTTYFYVRRIITAEKGKFVFEYGKRNRNTPDPCAFMDFAQYGSFTDKDRMSSMYFCSRGRSYIEVLDGVKTWEVQVENRVARYGYLGNLRVKRKDGTYIDLKGNGIFAQNNVYFGDNIFRLENISNLDELENLAASYDVTLSQYQSVLTIDDMGNVINGLYTEDEGKTTKQYRVSTAVFVRKGNNILLEEDEDNEDVTEGHYRLHVVSSECTCEVQNSTVFITGINNIKDGVLGSDDDDNFDYDAMRKMTDCMVTIVVDLEGKTSKVVQMPIRIQHDSLPFMVCDLTNEHASVSWHTKHKHYAGLPIETTVNMFYKNEPYEFGMRASLPKEVSDYLEVSVADSGKSKVLRIDKKADFSSDVLPTSFEVGIYCVSDYAGAKYEYTKKLSVSKTADAVIYEIVPSANSVSVNSKNEVSPSSVGCEVWATSSDDKRYQVTTLPDGYSLYYQKDGGMLNAMQLGAKIAVAATDKEIAFVLQHTENGVTYVDDKEGVPVVKDGKGGMMALCSDNMVSVSVDVNGKVAAALNSTLSFRLFAGEKELTVSGISINASPTSKVVTATVSGNTLNLSCDVGADFGKYDMSYIIKVDGKDGSVSYSSYVAVKVVPNVLGKGMVSVNTWYALGDSATEKPSDSEFTYDIMGAAVIESNADKYLWSGDKITYSDRSTAFTGIYLVGKCSELASVTEQYAKTTTAVEPTDGWADTYPSPVAKGDYIWSRDKITWKNGSVSYSAAQLAGYIGVDGKGYEYVYYLASENKTPTKPSRRAEATLTGGWTDSIPSMDSSHGYIFVSCRQGKPFAESSQDEWSTPVLYARLPKQIDSVNTWYGLSSSITTLPSSYSYDKMSDAVIKDNADKYLWSADKVTYTDGTSEFTGTYCVGKCSELASIKEQYGTSTSSTTKPTSWSDTYPSNLTKGTYIWTRDFITWKNGGTEQTDAQLAGYIGTDGAGQVVAYKRATSMPNYTPSVTDYDTYKGTDDLGSGWTKSAPSSDDSLVSGGSVSSVSANKNTNGGTWSSVADGGYNWYKSPSVADNGIATMRIYFTTSEANQYVTFYLRAYSETNYDFVLISGVDSTSLTRDSGYTARVSGNGNDTYIRLKCSTAGQHFVTVAYAKDVSGSNNGDYGLVRMATSENYISQSSILFRCDGSVTENVISWGSIYQAQGDKGDNGDKGDQGVGISSVTTYYLISSLSSGVSTSTSGWTTSMVNPTSSKPYLWSYTMTTLTDGSEVNTTPVIIGNFAEAGPMGTNGCIVRNSIWKSGVEYRNDSALTTDGVKYLDYVYVENSNANDGWDKYVCNTTHTSTSYNGPTSSYGYWTKLSDAGPIYSPLIVAKNAAINFAQGQQFNLVSSNSIFGSFRIPGSDGYALWLGGSSASDAPFKVNKDGKMVASDAEITGKITADSGSIGGVTITQSWLGSGVIELGNEYYTGAILSNKGLFTGYKNCYFGAGGFADTNPKGEFNKMYEMDGTSNVNGNMSAPAAYIRKYTPENSILNNIDKPYGAALIVDVPRGVGITSYGANIFGSLALGALASSSSIGSTNTLFQRNRASVAVLTSGGDFYLPSNPQQGQIVIVIHAGGSKVTFYHPGKSLVTYQGVKSSGSFYSSTKGQFNFFVYIDSMWYGTYCNG